jgi:hypothetical protein
MLSLGFWSIHTIIKNTSDYTGIHSFLFNIDGEFKQIMTNIAMQIAQRMYTIEESTIRSAPIEYQYLLC